MKLVKINQSRDIKGLNLQTLKNRMVNASIWTFGGNLVGQLIRLVSNLIMTRLLIPEMFGLMAMANVFIFGLHLMSDVGLNQSLIQNKRTDDAFVNTVWTTQVLRGFLIWFFALFLAFILLMCHKLGIFPIDSVYSDSRLAPVLSVIGFTSVIAGFESTKFTLKKRSLQLKENILIILGSQLLGIIFMLCYAYVQKNVWALVFGGIVSTTLQVLASHLIIEGKRNYFHWNKESFIDILHYGKWIFISSIMGFLLSSSDRLLLGAIVDSQTLGYYAIAFLMFSALRDLFANVIHGVVFPALSETYRENPEELKSVFYKVRLPFDVTLIFLTGVLIVSGPAIVSMLYDARYHSSGWMLQFLAIGLFEVRFRVAGEYFMAIGKPRILNNVIIASLVILYLVAPVAYHYFSLKGLILVIATSPTLALPLQFYYLKKDNILDWVKEIRVIPILLVGLLVGYSLNFLLVFIKAL